MRGFWLVAATGLAWSATVHAQSVEVVDPPPQPVASGHTVDVVLGLGFGGYTSKLAQESAIGLSWTLRSGYNISRFFGVEFTYLGTSTLGSSTTAAGSTACCGTLLENQITFGAKAGVPIPIGRGFLRPYAFAGAGFGYISATANSSVMTTTPSHGAAAFPFGGALAYEFARGPEVNEFLPGVIIDVRYTYTVLTASAGDVWNVLFELGGRIPSR